MYTIGEGAGIVICKSLAVVVKAVFAANCMGLSAGWVAAEGKSANCESQQR